MIPAVTVELRLKGLPTANTHSPIFALSESTKERNGSPVWLILMTAMIGVWVDTYYFSLVVSVIIKRYFYYVGILHDVIIGNNVSIRINDHTRA